VTAVAWAAEDKSAVGANAISLPKGPGSIQGLGEAFQPTLNTGTAKYAITLAAPPGTAGFGPTMTLRYEGGGANGPLGFGWGFDQAFVQRQTDKGIPRYVDGPNAIDDDGDLEVDEADELDVFINDASEELVPVENAAATATDYFSKNEGAFVRYRRNGDAWEATLPDGSRMELGSTPEGRITDPATGHIFRWNVQKMVDTRGNTILFHYRSFAGTQNTNQKYLWKIEYGPGAPRDTGTPWDNFHFISLTGDDGTGTGAYEGRTDWFEDARPGFLLRTGVRLTKVVIGTQGPLIPGHDQGDYNSDGIPDNLVRMYRLDYFPDEHWSLLASVTPMGADSASTLPSTSFDYIRCAFPNAVSAENAVRVSLNEPPVAPGNPLVDLIDLNGDALPDLLRTDGQPSAISPHTAYLNYGATTFNGEPVLEWAYGEEMYSPDGAAFETNLQVTGSQLSDADGDGSADLWYKSLDGTAYYFRNLGKGALGNAGWGARERFYGAQDTPPSPFGVPNVRSADLDFDKRMDIIQSEEDGLGGATYKVWFNLGENEFSEFIYSKPVLAEPPRGYSFDSPGVELVDFNGDRVTDVAQIRPTQILVTTGLGYGQFTPETSVPIPGSALDDTLVVRAKLRDINGDGLPDLVVERASGSDLWYWLNLGNYTLDARRAIVGMPTVLATEPTIRWADMNGNGTTDIVYIDTDAYPQMQMVDIGELLGCAPSPHLLTSIDNGIGRINKIEYASSVDFSIRDRIAGHPWPDPMPNAVTVVAAVTTEDSMGNTYHSEFRYHDGYYDGVEKQFRGFARVEQIEVGDPGTNSTAPTLVTHNVFDTGRTYEAMKGRLLRQVSQDLDPLGLQDPDDAVLTFTDERTTYVDPPVALYNGLDGKVVRYAHPVSTQRDTRERLAGPPGALGIGPVRTQSEVQYDTYGNQTVSVNYGLVLGNDLSYQDDEQVTINEYAINTDKWILRALARQELMDEVAYSSWLGNGTITAGKIVARTETFYDDETFAGTNFGMVTIGNATMIRKWTDTDSPSAFVTASRAFYDDYGNPVQLLDPLADAPGGVINTAKGHFRTVDYDARFQTYPVAETIHLEDDKAALQVQATYDEGFGTLLTSQDFNGNITTCGYDTFSRLVNIVRPLDSQEFPTAEYDYYLAQPASNGHLVNYIETRQLDKAPPTSSGDANRLDYYHRSRTFVDGLGRTLLAKEEAQNDPDSGLPQVAVSGAVLFNQRRSAAKALQPFYTLIPGATLEEKLAFEDIRDAGWSGAFHENGQSVNLPLANAQVVTSAYDALQRATVVTNPDGTKGESKYFPLYTKSYDENDTDANSVHAATPMIHYNDGLGRLVRVDELAHLNDDGTFTAASDIRTWTTRYAYRLDGALEKITDSQNNQKSMQYDALQRNLFMDDPDRGVMHWIYDDASNLKESVDAKGQHITYTYDGANRILTEDFLDDANPTSFHYNYNPLQPVTPANRPDVAYFYDVPAGAIDLGDGTSGSADGNNAKGMLAYVWDLSGEEHVSYDQRDRVVWNVKRVPDPETGALTSYRTAMAYDSFDRITALTYPDADRCTYGYNERTTLARINGGALHNRDGAAFLLDGLNYAPSGQLLGSAFGNGIQTTYAYDNRNRLNNVRTAPSHLADMVYLDYAYTFDNTQNLTRISDLRPASVLAAGKALRNTQAFQYDDLYRLTRVGYAFAAPGAPEAEAHHIGYRYDRIGNMLAMDSDITQLERGVPVANVGDMRYGGGLGPKDRVGRTDATPGPHALTSAGPAGAERHFDYDPNGNMTSLDGLTCTWDFADRLRSVEDDKMRAEYIYDNTDRRIVKKVWNKKAGTALDTATQPPDLFTVYVNRNFEVREYEQPVKYVWNGDNRIASVTGTLDTTATRVQRVRLKAGWNLFAVVLHAHDAATQLGLRTGADPASAQRWDRTGQGFVPVGAGDSLPAGTVLWMHVDTPRTLALRGTLPADTGLTLVAGGDFAAPMALEAAPTAPLLAKIAPGWLYDARTRKWTPDVPGPVTLAPAMPAFLPPGAAVFTNVVTARNIATEHPERRIQYYHADHLGSSNTVTDALGDVTEEHAFYPFGEVRVKRDVGAPKGPASVKYLFTQKEKDEESGLQYFEARYLAAGLGRFNRVDPLASGMPDDWISSPQKLNHYSYCLNNPLRWTDPDGCDVGQPDSTRNGGSGGYGHGDANIGRLALAESERSTYYTKNGKQVGNHQVGWKGRAHHCSSFMLYIAKEAGYAKGMNLGPSEIADWTTWDADKFVKRGQFTKQRNKSKDFSAEGLREGDVISFDAKKAGHWGIVAKGEDGKLKLVHASLSKRKVVAEDLGEYLDMWSKKKNARINVWRAIQGSGDSTDGKSQQDTNRNQEQQKNSEKREVPSSTLERISSIS
jgi:RHS repeat-associated protein